MDKKEVGRRMIEARKKLERENEARDTVKEEKGLLMKHIRMFLKDPAKTKSLA